VGLFFFITGGFMSVQVISFNCVLKNKAGKLISSTFNREVITGGSAEDIVLAGLAKGLENLSKGEKRSIELKAEDAYGLYLPQKVILFPRKKMPQNVRIGQLISIVGKSGKVRSYKVLEYHDDMVSLDGNHPLAGQDLVFEIEALEAREATAQEIAESSNPIAIQQLH
jgi:FKBP-type peptidyl-prolyl cis-trans isomerase SlyD